jgi:uncharacterized OB-fold protein
MHLSGPGDRNATGALDDARAYRSERTCSGIRRAFRECQMNGEPKPVPAPSESDEPYWSAAGEHRLVLQKCVVCHLYSAQPRLICPVCRGESFEWTQISGRGTIHSYTIVHHTTVPGFGDGPYVVAIIQIEEDPRCYLTTNLLVSPDEFAEIAVDAAVAVEFETRESMTLPQFRLAKV